MIGYEVFLDTLDIEGGIDWSNKIKEEINNSEIVIALITEAVFKSKYIPGEIKEAINKQKLIIPCVRNNVDLTKLPQLGLTKEQVIVFNDNELDKLYGKINDSIASYKKNPQKVKEYYEKIKKQKKVKIAISAIVGSVLAIVLVAYFVQPQPYLEEKYVFVKSWGNLSTNNLEFKSPTGVTIDSKNNLYVADTGNNRIQKIQPDGNVTSIGEYGFTEQEFILPSGVAVDNKDILYVADTGNNRIQKIQPDGNVTVIVTNIWGDPKPIPLPDGIQPDGNVTAIETYGSTFGEIILPPGVAVDSKDILYVADTGNNRIQKIQPDGNITSIGREGSTLGEFDAPSGIAVDSKDNLYVADSGNNRIQKIQPDGNVTIIAENGSELGESFTPSGIAIDSKDNLYVTDIFNHRINQFVLSKHWEVKFGK